MDVYGIFKEASPNPLWRLAQRYGKCSDVSQSDYTFIPWVWLRSGLLFFEVAGEIGLPCVRHDHEHVDQLLIKQKVEVIEALVGFESNNKYEVRNSMGQNVFYAVEENDCLSRQCCGPMRSFTIHILDNFGQEIITIIRPLRCMSCFFPCCLQELEVQAPPGNTVGYITQQWHPISPKFTVENELKEPVLRIHGPFCGWSCLPDVDFEIITMDETSKIGKISKQWMKAVMIGACFLIDFMFFESTN
ncbi:hypothetical protein WMY93_030206 [Mugilogobius chulae]|uniref:Phospholipid scramblase n=1 Tax=Mugilogobius chulae TaxID=88201 RepID=A0AAW0MRL7_9GOBI